MWVAHGSRRHGVGHADSAAASLSPVAVAPATFLIFIYYYYFPATVPQLDRPIIMLDFGSVLAPPPATVFASPGGEWDLAVDSQDKLGLISLTPWSHVAIVLPLAGTAVFSHARFSIGYLKTWRNVSAVGYWVDTAPGLPAAGQDGGVGAGKPGARCKPAFAEGLEKIDAFNPKYESVYDAFHFKHEIEIGKGTGGKPPGTLYLHLCLLPYAFSAINDRSDFPDKGKVMGKFKLLSVIMYRHSRR